MFNKRAFILLLSGITLLYGKSIILPRIQGIVHASDHGASGKDREDDTRALQAALDAAVGGILYLPNGTYIITETLEWPQAARHAPLTLQGQSTTGTILKIPEKTAPFANRSAPQPVIWTQKMGSADNFRNHIRNLSIDIGAGNPGAIGIQFMSNNMGAVTDVSIRSVDGAGKAGLDLAYNNLNGPLLVKNLEVIGFDIGISCRGAVNSQTLEHIFLKDQKKCGILNNGQVLSIRGVISDNSVPAMTNEKATGVITLVDAALSGGSPHNTAIMNSGGLFCRNLSVDGYTTALHSRDSLVPGPFVREFCSHAPLSLWESGAVRSLHLPVEETPEIPWDSDKKNWATVLDFGADLNAKTDDTKAVQKAFSSHKSTIFLPKGTYTVDGTIEIKGNVSRIVGCESKLSVGSQADPVLTLVDAPGTPSAVEILFLSVTPTNATPAVDNASQGRTLIVKHCKGFGGIHTGTGRVFYEDVGTGVKKPMQFIGGKGQRAFLRQLSNEPREYATHLVNNSAAVWCLGHKTEMPGILVHTSGNGATEICGGFAYTVGGSNADNPMYLVENARFSCTMGGAHFARKYPSYSVLVKEVRDEQARSLGARDAYSRSGFRMMPLFAAGKTNPARPHRIDAFASPGGTIAPSGAVYTVDGETPAFYADALPGYRLEHMYVDEAPHTGSSYTFEPVRADHMIRALFMPEKGGAVDRVMTPRGMDGPSPWSLRRPRGTEVLLHLRERGSVTMRIFDVSGALIRKLYFDNLEYGRHRLGSGRQRSVPLSAGCYLMRTDISPQNTLEAHSLIVRRRR